MKTKKVQRRRRKTLQRRRKTLRMHGGENSITFLVDNNDKCTFNKANKIFVKRGNIDIGYIVIDDNKINYFETQEYDLGIPSSSTPITKISSIKKTTPELSDEEKMKIYLKNFNQSRANDLELSNQFSNIKDNPGAGVDVQRMVENYRKLQNVQNQKPFTATRRRHK